MLQAGVDKAAKKGAVQASNVMEEAAVRRPLATWFSRGAWKEQNAFVEDNYRTVYVEGKPVRQTLDDNGDVIEEVELYSPPAGFPALGQSATAFTKPGESIKKRPAGAYVAYATEEKKAEAEALEEQERLEQEGKYVRSKEESGGQPSSSAASSSQNPLLSKPKEESPPEATLTEADLGLSEQEIVDEMRQIDEANLFCPSMWSVVSLIYSAENLSYESFLAQVKEKSAKRSAELQQAKDKLVLARQEKQAAADLAAQQALAAEEGAVAAPEEPAGGTPELCDPEGQSGIAIGNAPTAASDQERQEAADELMVPPQPTAPAAAPPSEPSDPHSLTDVGEEGDENMKDGAVSLGSESDPPGDA